MDFAGFMDSSFFSSPGPEACNSLAGIKEQQNKAGLKRTSSPKAPLINRMIREQEVQNDVNWGPVLGVGAKGA